jgi:hypothetical protein
LPGTIRTGRKLKRMIDRRFVAEKVEPDFEAEGVADEQLV